MSGAKKKSFSARSARQGIVPSQIGDGGGFVDSIIAPTQRQQRDEIRHCRYRLMGV